MAMAMTADIMMMTRLLLIAPMYYKLNNQGVVAEGDLCTNTVSLRLNNLETPIAILIEVDYLDETQTRVTLAGIGFKVLGTGNPLEKLSVISQVLSATM